jgi:hypothetical protein
MLVHWVRRLGRLRASIRWKREERVGTKNESMLLLKICVLPQYVAVSATVLRYILLSMRVDLDIKACILYASL